MSLATGVSAVGSSARLQASGKVRAWPYELVGIKVSKGLRAVRTVSGTMSPDFCSQYLSRLVLFSLFH